MFSIPAPDWPLFVTAVIFLWAPLPLFFGKSVEFRELNRSWHRAKSQAVSLPWHWVDLLRAAAGTWLLQAAMGIDNDVGEAVNVRAVAASGAVLAVGVIIETVVRRIPDGFFIPFVYVLGAAAVWFPPVLAVPALITAVLGAVALRTLAAFLWFLPVTTVGFANWTYPSWAMVGLGAAVPVVAALLPVMFQRECVFAHRALPVDEESLRPLR
ncbi:MAG: hypothetical protein RLZZ15_4185 [Verrucomicrobiota bacterium]|jgi:hypothetical protein